MQNGSKEIKNVNVVVRSGSRMKEGTGIGNERRNIVAIRIVKEVVEMAIVTGTGTGIVTGIEIVTKIGVEIVIAGEVVVEAVIVGDVEAAVENVAVAEIEVVTGAENVPDGTETEVTVVTEEEIEVVTEVAKGVAIKVVIIVAKELAIGLVIEVGKRTEAQVEVQRKIHKAGYFLTKHHPEWRLRKKVNLSMDVLTT